MLKKILILPTLLLAGISFGQNIPTMVSYTVDTLCDGDFNKQFITITVEDLDADSTYLTNVVPMNSVLDVNAGFTIISPPYVPTETLRTFQIIGSANWGLPSGVNLEDIGVDIIGNSGNDGGAGYAQPTGIPVYGYIQVDFTTSTIDICTSGPAIDLNQYAVTPGGTWSWANQTSPYEYSETNALDPSIAYDVFVADGGDGYYIEYTLENSAGCSGYSMLEVGFFDPFDVNMAVTPSTCENADGSATATIVGTSSPYDVYWTTGFSETLTGAPTSTINNASSGVYYANITDMNGCKAVGKANIYDADMMVSETITPVYCAGQTGSVDLDITSSGTVTSIYWSNGQTTEVMNAPAGEYSVQIHTDNNCNFFGTYEVLDSALTVIVNDVSDNFNCLTTPSGYVDITTVGGIGTYTWDWTKNSSAFATSEDISGIDGGLYVCTVTDGNGCEYAWNETIGNNSNVYLFPNEIVKSTCGNMDGSVDIFIDTFGDTPTFYEWSNGSTDEDLTGVAAGSYTLTYTDQGGCTNFLTVDVADERPYQPQICLLTVDTSFTYNQVVWEKVPGEAIDGFKIYRETSVFGIFEEVADRPVALESFFMDNSASPADRSWRYAVTTYDACGNESFKSFIHKTIHTVASTTNGTDYTISWDDYEGITYTSVDLYRHDDTNGWLNIGNFPVGTNSSPDTPPVLSGLDYIVSFNLSDPCTSTKATDYNSSRSNRSTSSANYNPGGSTVSLEDEELGEINIYPNPTNGNVFVYVEKAEEFEAIVVRDMNGKIIQTLNTLNVNNTIDLGEYSTGVYFISILSTDKIINQKIVKK
ncbi:MAG: T9SS type A sorting domain-containing protein [Crocinitomicaceae bacterium]